jgi:hypothetical protein
VQKEKWWRQVKIAVKIYVSWSIDNKTVKLFKNGNHPTLGGKKDANGLLIVVWLVR